MIEEDDIEELQAVVLNRVPQEITYWDYVLLKY